MKYFVHYRTADGEIFGWGNGFDPVLPIADNAVAFFDDAVTPDPTTQKIDPATGELIGKTAEEQYQARLPKPIEVRQAIWIELERTDRFVLADYPIDDDARQRWITYRQMLRDLSKRFEQPTDMINAWDEPPDGSDPIPGLRARL